MKPVPFPEVNCIFQRDPHPEYDRLTELPVHLTPFPQAPSITTCWELSDDDMELIKTTRRIYLTVFGETLPAVLLRIKPPFINPGDN